MHQLPIPGSGGAPASHLAVRYERPERMDDDAPVVLYLHGFGSNQSGTKADYFRRRYLAAGLPFCSFDLQGHGESGGGMEGMTLTRNLADVDRVRDWLGEEHGHRHFVLMGSSMGGGTLLWHASRRPENVVAAVHLAPSFELHEGLLRRVGPENAAKWERDGKLFFEHELMSCDLGWTLIEDLRSYDLADLRARTRTPTLIFHGKNDVSVSWRASLDFTVGCAFEEVELHLMADADHRMIDRTDYLWDLLHAFLVRRGAIRTGG